MVKPIFLFSLPRSGSTLLQRLLSRSDSICTNGETWLLLPMFLPLAGRFGFSHVNERDLVAGLNDFLRFADGPGHEYHSRAHDFAVSLYTEACKNNKPAATYFLDKTPRYHLICASITRAFPDARFIYLWRNPLDIAHSMIETWCENRWNINEFAIDLDFGFDQLARCCRDSTAATLSLKYEELVQQPEAALAKLSRFLEIEIPAGGELPEPPANSELGDQTGINRYDAISEGSVDNWTSMLDSGVRRRWIERYLASHKSVLEQVGYGDLQDRFSSACLRSRTSATSSARDLFWGTYHSLIARFNINTIRDQRELFFNDPRTKLR